MPFEVLTPEEAAERLKIPRSTVIAMCAAGELVGARKAGRRWRIPSTAIDAFFGVKEEAQKSAPSEARDDVPERLRNDGPDDIARLRRRFGVGRAR